MERMITTFFGAGLLKPAPGTWASAIAVLLGLGLYRIGHFPLLLVSMIAITALGFWACERSLAPGEDPSEVVIDEVAGQWLALCFPAFGFWWMGLGADRFPYPGWVSAFVLFRLFDIWKPWLVGRADRRGDAKGVMLDDIYAGIFAGIGTIVLAGLFHAVILL